MKSQNFRVAVFIDDSATFTTAGSIVLLGAKLAKSSKIEQRQ
ncbi:hypothetical protein [Streptococcus gallolyticus]|nr:hypothetical protein [Streptococcus gallolyticus]EFM29156.1 hypothetical protein HMPREF9352_1562 [Streptococcus gallolyticus subsp. gallolyticus TX20005]